MKTFVLITLLVELLAGLALLIAPTLFPDLKSVEELPIGLARMYGAAALAMAYLAFQVWRSFENPALRDVFLKTFSAFHILVALAALVAYKSGGFSDAGIFALHTILAIATLYFYWKTRQPDKN